MAAAASASGKGGAPTAAAGAKLQLSGVQVAFPHEPYGVQKVFMAQVVKAIDHEENALLEAPTGCGKTLSLLCGALAWQAAAKAKKAAAEQAAAEKAAAHKGFDTIQHEEDAIEDSQASPSAAAGDNTKRGNSPAPPEEAVVVPKIYYATRTHSQIAQVVKELKRTIYKPKMAVLGSRPHYCINAAVIRKGNIDAECEELLKDGMGCKYKKNVNNVSHRVVQVHDIEDLAKIGKRHTACPYFVARSLADSAELIFCPYSYLLDPNIRRATRINAADAILIFDEAHNIEDQAREAGTMELELESLKSSVMSLTLAANSSAEGEHYRELADAAMKLISWMLNLADGNAAGAPGQGFKQAGFESFERIWTAQPMLSALAEAGLGPQEVEHLWACYEKAKAAEEKAGFATEGDAALEPVPAEIKTPRAGGNALGCISSMLAVLRLMYGTYTEAPSVAAAATGAAAGSGGGAAAAAGSGGGGGGGGGGVRVVQSVPGVDHVADYRLAVQMWLPRESNHNNRGRRDRRRPDTSTDSFADTMGCAAATTSWAFRFCLWCLNPAVVFRSLSGIARSVLLTSGTLSPLDSFSGELGLDFHVKLEAPHVVDVGRQVFARVVGQGLDGRKLRATYKEADQLEYQDSLGQLVLATAGTVPDGLLLFLPSYALMDKLYKRWQDTGLLTKLQRVKAVFQEPRQAGDAFDLAIRRYYEAVDGGQGGMFMAVCRGKVSEGIDFADGRARCVMVVGIPYPHAKDSKVALKKDYNNATSAASARAGGGGGGGWQQQQQGGYGGGGGGGAGGGRGGPPRLLTGDAWYSQQAFRALNQAIGRCIRHRLDYGAILLVDERFKEGRNQASLSKWVRGSIKTAAAGAVGAAGAQGGGAAAAAGAAATQALLQEMAGFFQGLAACPPGSNSNSGTAAAAGAAAMTVQHQQLAAVKAGYQSEPGLMLPPAGVNNKPGFEAAPGCMPGCAGAPMYDQQQQQQCCGGAGGNMKPGYEAAAAGGAGGNDSTRSRWQQQPQLLPGGGGSSSKQPRQQQQQQPKPQQQQQRVMGPMDSYLVKAANKQQQQQQQKQQELKGKPELLPPQPHPQQQQQPSAHPAQQQQQQMAAAVVPLPQDQQQGAQQQQRQPVSCLSILKTPCKPCPQPQQQQPQQQQPEVLQPLDCNVLPCTTPTGACKVVQGQHVGGSGSKGSAERAPGQRQPTAGSCAEPHPVATAGSTAPAPAAAQPPVPAAAVTGPGDAAAAVVGSGGGGGGGSCSSPRAQLLQQGAAQLGLSLQVLQQWVVGDVGSMVACLQQQQAAAVAAGMQVQELACFGILASFDKAIEICSQQQQQQQPGFNSSAAAPAAASLSSFWQLWHSYVPTGLVAAAAAAGQPAPDAVVCQPGRGQWQGPWLQAMQQQGLVQTLTAMAGLYDQVLEQQLQQQQQQPQGGSESAHQQGQQQLQGLSHNQPGQNAPLGCQPHLQQQQFQQQQFQQQPWAPQAQAQWQQQQQPGRMHPNQQQQQQPSGWPHSDPHMGAPHNRQQRHLPASLQPQQQHNRPGAYNTAGSSHATNTVGGAMRPPAAGNAAGRLNPVAGGGGAAGASTHNSTSNMRPPPKLQLSQSAQQPKRAAVLSAKAQLAAQKRTKLAAAGGQQGRVGQQATADSSEDDDEFM